VSMLIISMIMVMLLLVDVGADDPAEEEVGEQWPRAPGLILLLLLSLMPMVMLMLMLTILQRRRWVRAWTRAAPPRQSHIRVTTRGK